MPIFPPTQPVFASTKRASSKSKPWAPGIVSARQVWPLLVVRATKPFQPAIQAVVGLTAVTPLIAVSGGAPTSCAVQVCPPSVVCNTRLLKPTAQPFCESKNDTEVNSVASVPNCLLQLVPPSVVL